MRGKLQYFMNRTLRGGSAAQKRREGGFTLLEVILSVSILLTLSISATTVIRNSLQMKTGIAEQAELTHRLGSALQRFATDLGAVYIIDSKRSEVNYGARATKTIFNVKKDGASYELLMTTMSHRPVIRDSHQSDQTFVVYKVKADEGEAGASGRYSLYRGESKVIPENFDEEIPMEKIADGVKTFQIFCWNGEKWSEDRWDSNRSEWRNKLPQMVRIELEMWEAPFIEGAAAEAAEGPTTKVSTVVYLPRSYGLDELKQRSSRVRWEGK
jgi:type II secretory pathway pseudopilin PulG